MTRLAAAAPTGRKLGAKARELIVLAATVSTRCDGCMAVHSDAARRVGASKEEVAGALGVAMAPNAGAALVYTARAFEGSTGEAG